MTNLFYIAAGIGIGLLGVAAFNWWRGGRERRRLLAGGEWGKEPSLADAIIQSLTDDPDLWKFDHYHARHETMGGLWIANGYLSLGKAAHGKSINPIPFWDKGRVYRAIMAAREARDVAQFKNPQMIEGRDSLAETG